MHGPRTLAAVLVLLAVLALAGPAGAATHTWDGVGGANDNWSDAANWVGNSPPAVGEANVVLVFPIADPNSVFDAGLAGLVVERIEFTGSGATISGSAGALTIDGGGVNISDSNGGNEIDASLALTITNADMQVNVAAGTLSIESSISDTGGAFGLVKDQGGTLHLATAGANTYDGFTVVREGALLVNTVTADQGISGLVTVGDNTNAPSTAILRLLNSSEVPNNAVVSVLGDGLLDLTPGQVEEINQLRLGGPAGGGSAAIAAGAALQLAPGGVVGSFQAPTPSVVNGPGELRLDAAGFFSAEEGPADPDLAVNAVVGQQLGGTNLTKMGLGTVTLSAANTYTGITTVNAGTLLVDGSQPGSAVTLSGGGTLGGGGTTGAITSSAGTVSPGASPAILNASGNVALNAATTYAAELNGTAPGTGHDQLNVTGTVDLGGSTLAASLGYVPSGESLTIVQNDGGDPVTGTFAGLPEGADVTVGGQVFRITYQGGSGNDVALVHRPPDVSLTKDDAPDPVGAETNLTYTITVTNNGPSAALNARMHDAVPPGTTFVSFSAPAGWSTSALPPAGGTGAVVATKPTMASGESATFTLIVRTGPFAPGATGLSNTATASSFSADPVSSNNSDTEPTALSPDAADSDADGKADAADNCPAAANPDQADFDVDGAGDPCDPPRAGTCANPRTGTPGADRITGSGFGDRILALGGNDTVGGGDGNDCLDGGDGNDKLSGNDGDDTLTGGKGNDSLTGGKGTNSYSGGAGNDKVSARNRRQETVNCGSGKKDSATIDKVDRARGCEKVKRR